MGTSHSKRKCPKRHPREDETSVAKEHICSSSSRDVKHPMEKETKYEEERNCLPDAIVLESWTTASSSSSSITFSSNHSLSSSSVEYRQHPQRQPHPQSVGCRRPCSCSLPAAVTAADSSDKNRPRIPFSCINSRGNASSLNVSHASDDVSMENASNVLSTRKGRTGDNEELKGCGASRWRAFAWIIDMCVDGRRKKGGDKQLMSSNNNSSCSSSNGCKCSISGIGFKASTSPDRRGKIDKRRRQCVDAKRAINGRDDRPGSNCTIGFAADLWEAEEMERRRSEHHRHLVRQQTILGYDDKMLGDIIRINMIQNNVYVPSHSQGRHSDAFRRHSHCGRSRRSIKGGVGRGCVGDGGSGDGGGERRWWHLRATVEEEEEEEATTNDERQENETNIYVMQSTADDSEANGANDVGSSSDWHARHFRRSCCTSPGPNKDVRGPSIRGPSIRGPSIRLSIVHRSNDTHSFDHRTTAVLLPRRGNDPIPGADVANYLGSSIQDGRPVCRPEAVMSSCHYWHRHRHRERNQRRAMDRVAEWIIRDEENALQDVARKTRTVSHYMDHNHQHNRYHKNSHHHRRNWRHIIV